MPLTSYPIIDRARLSIDALTISQQLFEYSLDYQQRCIVLLDPFLTPFNDRIIDYFAAKARLHPVYIMHPSILASKRPLLLELNLAEPFERQVLSYIIEQALKQQSPNYLLSGQGQQYCAWLFSHAPIAQIANDLAHIALQKTHHGKTLLLRFYDPAVFRQLMSILTESQQHKLYGHLEGWALLNRVQQLIINQNIGKPRPVLSGQLGLTDGQLRRLHCIGINNQLLKKHHQQLPIIQHDECQILRHIMPSILRLLDKQIDDDTLLIEWAKLALKYHKDFDLHPEVIKATQHFTIRYDYYHWFESMREQSWQQIADDNRKKNQEIRE